MNDNRFYLSWSRGEDGLLWRGQFPSSREGKNGRAGEGTRKENPTRKGRVGLGLERWTGNSGID
jgi:hypothetical protein